MAVTTAQATYKKTKTGEWVAYGPADVVRVGDVEVAKRDGSTKFECVERLGRVFNVGGVDMVYGYLAKGAMQSAAPPARRRSTGCQTDGDCWSFGDIRYCHECGKG